MKQQNNRTMDTKICFNQHSSHAPDVPVISNTVLIIFPLVPNFCFVTPTKTDTREWQNLANGAQSIDRLKQINFIKIMVHQLPLCFDFGTLLIVYKP
jgi:hypothetical protein